MDRIADVSLIDAVRYAHRILRRCALGAEYLIMTTNSVGPHEMQSVYVHLGPDGTAIPLPVTDSFWRDIGSGAFDHLGPGRLVSQMEFAEDWSSWEMHPDGEEIVCLLSGAVEFILSKDGVERTVSLKAPGSYIIVPRGAWHTANVHAPGSMLFITPGEGTDHRPR